MNPPRDLAETISSHSGVLFGAQLESGAVRIAPVARGTRGIFRVEADGRRPIVVKRRAIANADERSRAMVETSHEFDVLSALWTSLSDLGTPAHDVPRPLLALPERGLLFMEQSRGEPLARSLRLWVLGVHSADAVSRKLARCGAWLASLHRAGSHITWPRTSPEATSVLAGQRVRHHVYKLIGLTGSELVDTLTTGATSRLRAWGIEPAFITRVERGFAAQFGNFSPAQDTQAAVHGKFSPADVLLDQERVSAVDLEQAGKGSIYLDPAYFLYQLYMTARWKPIGGDADALSRLRLSFLNALGPREKVDESMLDAFIAYYMCNSLRPDRGVAALTARRCAQRWLDGWLARVGQ